MILSLTKYSECSLFKPFVSKASFLSLIHHNDEDNDENDDCNSRDNNAHDQADV